MIVPVVGIARTIGCEYDSKNFIILYIFKYWFVFHLCVVVVVVVVLLGPFLRVRKMHVCTHSFIYTILK